MVSEQAINKWTHINWSNIRHTHKIRQGLFYRYGMDIAKMDLTIKKIFKYGPMILHHERTTAVS